jgi:hypothetical protein
MVLTIASPDDLLNGEKTGAKRTTLPRVLVARDMLRPRGWHVGHDAPVPGLRQMSLDEHFRNVRQRTD